MYILTTGQQPSENLTKPVNWLITRTPSTGAQALTFRPFLSFWTPCPSLAGREQGDHSGGLKCDESNLGPGPTLLNFSDHTETSFLCGYRPIASKTKIQFSNFHFNFISLSFSLSQNQIDTHIQHKDGKYERTLTILQ